MKLSLVRMALSKPMRIWNMQRKDLPEEADDRQEVSNKRNRSNTQEKTARECALTLLEFRDRTEQELCRKLKERGYSTQEIEETVLFLKEYRYLDDEAYAGRYIRSFGAKKSRRQIRADLERKGVSREVIDLQLSEEEVDEESQIRKLLLKKGYEPGKRMEAAEYRRLMGALGRRGFSMETVRRVMDGMQEERS